MIRKFIDRHEQRINCVPYEGRTGEKHYHVEVVRDGEVVDHYTLYSDAAVDFTARTRKWEEVTK